MLRQGLFLKSFMSCYKIHKITLGTGLMVLDNEMVLSLKPVRAFFVQSVNAHHVCEGGICPPQRTSLNFHSEVNKSIT